MLSIQQKLMLVNSTKTNAYSRKQETTRNTFQDPSRIDGIMHIPHTSLLQENLEQYWIHANLPIDCDQKQQSYIYILWNEG